MNKRYYNIFFHTHTVSGIVISVALYVIFFAGSFAFFRDEIVAWERNAPVENKAVFQHTDLNLMLKNLGEKHQLYGRDIAISRYYDVRNFSVNISAPQDTAVSGRRHFFYLDPSTQKTYNYAGNYSIGEFLYRLHFFAQLNFFGRSGYVIAGLISFFFLFAIITGTLVHWKKIVSNFYLFRPKAKLKTLWTDAHTALGVIGLPFQFVFALTGVYFIFAAIAMGPTIASVLYDGDTQKMYADLYPKEHEIPMQMKPLTTSVDVNALVDQTHDLWKNFEIQHLKLINYGDASMHIAITGHPLYQTAFTGSGKLIFNAQTGKINIEKDPAHNTYADAVTGTITRLHFGDFGGLGLKIVYFILGLLSCFVIISGILIWLVARDKRHIDPGKRKFNKWMGHVFIASCLSLYPVTAFTFIAVKLFVQQTDASRMTAIYHIFFYAWLLLTLAFTFKQSHYFTNKICLISGAILGFFVPIANGMVTGNWPWITYAKGYTDIFFIDIFWIILSGISLYTALKLRPKEKKTLKRS